MKTPVVLFCTMVLASGLFYGCSKEKSASFPEVPPDKVVERFYELLGDGGRLSNREAQRMVSTKYGDLNLDNFRKWTERFDSKTKLVVVKTVLPTAPGKNGDWIATVQLEVKTPSSFGDYFTTRSKVNLILDEKENQWKIDFMANTTDESHFLAEPADASADVAKEK